MPYSPTTWTEGVTTLGPTNMNHLETGVSNATTKAEAAIPAPIGPASNSGLVWNGSSWVAANIVNANIDAAAAIAYSKLNLAGGIVNNDVSNSAGIVTSKLSIANGDLAIAKLVDPTAGKVVGSSGGVAASVFPPGYEVVAPLEFTTTQTTTSTSLVDLGSFSAGTFEAVKYYFEVVVANLRHSAANQSVQFQLMEGASTVGNPVQFETQNVAGQGISCFVRIPFTPTAASHTYKVQWKTVGAGTATILATGVAPAEFRLVKA